MTELPPPDGRPATMFPRPDPWVEQARRDEAHRAQRHRNRRRWLFPLLAVVVAGVVGGLAALLVTLLDDEAAGDSAEDAAVTTITVVETTVPPALTIAPEDLVAVDEVWLVDRGDGVFDWGVAVRTLPGAPSRSGVEVAVRLVSAGGEVVESVTGMLGVIDADSPAAVAGRLLDPDDDPVRIEFDVSVGEPSESAAFADLFDVRALDRDGDELTGRIRSLASTEIGDLSVLFVWHDDDAEVIGTAPLAIEVLRPGVDARFAIDLSTEVVPDGRPDAIFWVR